MDPGLRLLGRFALAVDGTAVAIASRGQRVLAYLGLHRRAVMRAELAGCLWGECSEKRALANLRTTLWRLPAKVSSVIEIRGQCLALHPSVTCDVDDLEAAFWALAQGGLQLPVLRVIVARLARSGSHAPVSPDAVFALGEELLPGWYDDWALVARERLTELRLQGLELASTAAVEAGWIAGGVAAALAAIAAEPLRERPNAQMVAAHLAAGDRVAAGRAFHAYRMRLDTEMHVEPSLPLQFLATNAGLWETPLAPAAERTAGHDSVRRIRTRAPAAPPLR